MNKLRITLTGETARILKSKRTGNDFQILDIYVQATVPYSEKVAIFEDPRLPRGIYDVPVFHEVQEGRLQVRFDFEKVVSVEIK